MLREAGVTRVERLMTRLGEMVADRLVDRLWRWLEDDNALPVPMGLYDAVVDDPDMFARHEYRCIEAVSPRAAGIEAYRRAMRDEGFRCVSWHPSGDEQTVGIAPECGWRYAVVHRAGKHPHIDYGVSAPTQVVVG